MKRSLGYGTKYFIPLREIPVGSIWMAADGASYGYIVRGKDLGTEEVLVRGFNSMGWLFKTSIDWFKLQYRYYLVKA